MTGMTFFLITVGLACLTSAFTNEYIVNIDKTKNNNLRIRIIK